PPVLQVVAAPSTDSAVSSGAPPAARSGAERRAIVRVMVMVRATKNSEAGVMPREEMLAEMGRFNEELVKAGVMQAGDGLHPSSRGKRVRFEDGRKTVIDGPFAAEEVIAGF